MLITCPSCSSRYEIDSGRIGSAGRKVRCAACRESWFVAEEAAAQEVVAEAGAELAPGAEHDAAASPAFAEPADAPAAALRTPPAEKPVIEAERRASARRRRPRGKPKADRRRRRSDVAAGPSGPLRWAALAAALMLTAAPLTVLYRQRIVAALPRTGSLFSAVGIPVNLAGLSFEDVTSTVSRDGMGPVLEVEGRIANLGHEPRPIPPLQLVVEDGSGAALYTWPARAAEAEVAPSAAVGFTARLASPPPAGTRVRVTFAPEAMARAVASR